MLEVAQGRKEATWPSGLGLGLSACLIVKNEEQFLPECLASLRGIADEVVLVDTGSTDHTVEIAQAAGARVVHEEWRNDFSAARNRSLQEATGEWILVIDADERLQPGQAERLRQLLTEGQADAYQLLIVNFPDDEDARATSHRIGLFRNRREYRYEGLVHEQIGPSILKGGGKIVTCSLKLDHLGYDVKVRIAKGKESRNVGLIQRALKQDPGNPFMRYNLAQEHYTAGRFEEAVVQFRRCLWLAPADKVSYGSIAVYRMVDSLARLKRWEEALRLCDQYEGLMPDYTDLKFLDGVVALNAGDMQRALLSLLKAVGQGESPAEKYELVHAGSGSYKAWWYLGQVYERGGQDAKALAAYTGALAADVKYVPALRSWMETALRLASDALSRKSATGEDGAGAEAGAKAKAGSSIVAGAATVAYAQLQSVLGEKKDEVGLKGADAVYTALLNARGYDEALQVLGWKAWEGHEAERLHREGLVLLAAGRVEDALAVLEQALAAASAGAKASLGEGDTVRAAVVAGAEAGTIAEGGKAEVHAPGPEEQANAETPGILRDAALAAWTLGRRGAAVQYASQLAGWAAWADEAAALRAVLVRGQGEKAAQGLVGDSEGQGDGDGDGNADGMGVDVVLSNVTGLARASAAGLGDAGDPGAATGQEAVWNLIARCAFLGLGDLVDGLVAYLQERGVQESLIRRRLGEVFWALHLEELAVELFIQAALQGEHTDTSLQIIAMYARRKGFLREAEAVLRHVMESNPEDAVVVLRLAGVLEEQGKGDEALAVVREAQGRMPNSAILRSWMRSHGVASDDRDATAAT
ncbi:MAG: glycosyltransferase [Limnochordaceae bacterium]|nr:glycosyltransferase [Limnochordaceae bacterium]